MNRTIDSLVVVRLTACSKYNRRIIMNFKWTSRRKHWKNWFFQSRWSTFFVEKNPFFYHQKYCIQWRLPWWERTEFGDPFSKRDFFSPIHTSAHNTATTCVPFVCVNICNQIVHLRDTRAHTRAYIEFILLSSINSPKANWRPEKR